MGHRSAWSSAVLLALTLCAASIARGKRFCQFLAKCWVCSKLKLPFNCAQRQQGLLTLHCPGPGCRLSTARHRGAAGHEQRVQ